MSSCWIPAGTKRPATGSVNRQRFPDGLASHQSAKLDGYGMKLGLWFNPTVAAVFEPDAPRP